MFLTVTVNSLTYCVRMQWGKNREGISGSQLACCKSIWTNLHQQPSVRPLVFTLKPFCCLQTATNNVFLTTVEARGTLMSCLTVYMSHPDHREPFYFSIWLGQGVMWGGHSMFCSSACLAECGSQSEAAVFVSGLYSPSKLHGCFCWRHSK